MMRRTTRAIAGRLGPGMVRLLARSWRVQVLQPEQWSRVADAGRPYLLVCWHETILPVMWHHRDRGIAALISEARDGGYLASLAAALGYGLIRGSSSRSGRRALLGAVRALRRGVPVGITPDGPTGPRRVLKPGVISAAQLGGAVILPVHAEARPGWRAGSWDRFLVPPAFSRVRLAYGTPFEVGRGAAALPAAMMRATRELDLAARLAAWPDGAATPTG